MLLPSINAHYEIIYHSSHKSVMLPSCMMPVLFPVKYRDRVISEMTASGSGRHCSTPLQQGKGGDSQFVTTWLLYSCVWEDMKEAWKFQRAILGNPLQVPLGNGLYPNNSINYN